MGDGAELPALVTPDGTSMAQPQLYHCSELRFWNTGDGAKLPAQLTLDGTGIWLNHSSATVGHCSLYEYLHSGKNTGITRTAIPTFDKNLGSFLSIDFFESMLRVLACSVKI